MNSSDLTTRHNLQGFERIKAKKYIYERYPRYRLGSSALQPQEPTINEKNL